MKMIQLPDSMCKNKQVPTFISTDAIEKIAVHEEARFAAELLREIPLDAKLQPFFRVVMSTFEAEGPNNYYSPWMSEEEAASIAVDIIDRADDSAELIAQSLFAMAAVLGQAFASRR